MGDIQAAKALAGMMEHYVGEATDELGRVNWMLAGCKMLAWIKDNQR